VGNIDGIHTIKCPHCSGGRHAVLQCGCGGLACGGRVRYEGNRQYQECPWCHSVGVIRGEIEKLGGERSTSHRGLPSRGSSQQQLKTTADTSLKLPSGQRKMTKR
jgi:Zn-finger nucleic acid-binding protein